ncbi:MAG: glycoside hydrolase family 15 protein, partial [Gammaproteobacteria bacterium]
MPPMAPIANPTDRRDRLDGAYVQVRDIILARQDPITGLLPASTAINAHGDYTDAWVRDNVYSIMCAWGLAMAMRREDYAESRAYLLEQSTVKLMRGLLTAMMKQSSKVERFKASLAATDALHAKYDTSTGDPVVGDGEWGHLQIDATSLFLLMLAQMTASGLRIVFTLAEVAFVQNLVHYIGRAYRIPDYGIWERGNKINHGITELNSSSIGMAKAAMEALSGFDLFGGGGGRASVIHVVPDEIARTRISLFSMLPRESGSKEVDAATLSVVGFPAFAVEDNELLQRTLDEVTEKLEGRYGCKRFLLDGHQTVLEDTGKLHYEPEELKAFENIECEWPLFFTYQLLNTLFLGDHEQASAYRAKLELCLADVDGQGLLPELYFVPMDKVEAEREHPHSQTRQPNENVPLVWAQSLYILGTLVHDGLLDLNDIDPLGRHRRVGRQAGRRVQIALLSSTPEVQEHLLARGIETETLEQIRPVELHQTEQLSLVYEQVGRNDKLGLSGRPFRHARALATSRVYELEGRRMLFLPLSLDRRGFYLAHDERMLVEQLKADLAYAHRHWDLPGRPLITILITESHLNDRYSEVLLDLVEALQQGRCEGVPVHVGRVSQLLPTTSKERIDELFGFHFPDSLPERGAAPTRHLPFES